MSEKRDHIYGIVPELVSLGYVMGFGNEKGQCALKERMQTPGVDIVVCFDEAQAKQVYTHLLHWGQDAAQEKASASKETANCANDTELAHADASNLQVLHLPAMDMQPYDDHSPSMHIQGKRARCLLALQQTITRRASCTLVTSVQSFAQNIPSLNVFKHFSKILRTGDVIARGGLLSFFENIGFQRSDTVFEVGDYAVRGSIIDCFPPTSTAPVRLDFFDDTLESMRTFDVITQKSTQAQESLTLSLASELVFNEDTISCFRKKFRSIFSKETSLFQAVSAGRRLEGVEHMLPLFYDALHSLPKAIAACDDDAQTPRLFFAPHADEALQTHLKMIQERFDERCAEGHEGMQRAEDHNQTHARKNQSDVKIEGVLPPHSLYLSHSAAKNYCSEGVMMHNSHKQFEDTQENGAKDSPPLAFHFCHDIRPLKMMGHKAFFHKIEDLATRRHMIIGCKSEGRAERVQTLFKQENIKLECVHTLRNIISSAHVSHLDAPNQKSPHRMVAAPFPLKEAYIHPRYVLIPGDWILGESVSKKRHTQQNQTRQFFSDTNAYALGDFLVHKDHGVGSYLGLEAVDVEGCRHDCLVLSYAKDDKLFLPVENMDMLTHFASHDALVDVDRLGSAAWQHKKAKAKSKILEMAQHLLDTAAKRSLKRGEVMEALAEPYEDFAKGFPYMETEDQQNAIHDVIDDLMSGRPMDRLVCGDVGFGKTEVALRAAFIAASCGHQVVIVVPTTLLARQHFLECEKRFKNTGLCVRMLSRLVPSKQATQVKKDVKDGSCNILISTHAAFAKSLTFDNLGLVIVDEEHHFGVKQKEALKSIRANIHMLTLTATPIPRTLQMSLSGIRDMSLMTTPPKDRLPIRTSVLTHDEGRIRDIILREHKRGGQIFYVLPRLSDMNTVQEMLSRTVPHMRIATAHGQMQAKSLEDVIEAFYDQKFDILLCTNIIESGIDVPRANTLIVHKAHLFGLAQLYQMRGRVGRGSTQAYAYLTVPDQHALTDTGVRRLRVLKSLDHLGAGFNLASHDMDIRGAGNLVGEQQSGHIKEVGAELYQQMLEDAIHALRSQQHDESDDPKTTGDSDALAVCAPFSPVLNLGVSILIPEEYIKDLSLRLSLYRRASRLTSTEEIQNFGAELIDRFGQFPQEVQHFLHILELKILCQKAGIEKVEGGCAGITMTFHDHKCHYTQALMAFVQKNSKIMRLKPHGVLLITGKLSFPEKRLLIAHKVIKKLSDLASRPLESELSSPSA